MPVQVIKKAQRLPDGHIPGVGAPQLFPKVVHHLTLQERVKLNELGKHRAEAHRRLSWCNLQTKRLMETMGLDQKKNYKFMPDGEVHEIGSWQPRYD